MHFQHLVSQFLNLLVLQKCFFPLAIHIVVIWVFPWPKYASFLKSSAQTPYSVNKFLPHCKSSYAISTLSFFSSGSCWIFHNPHHSDIRIETNVHWFYKNAFKTLLFQLFKKSSTFFKVDHLLQLLVTESRSFPQWFSQGKGSWTTSLLFISSLALVLLYPCRQLFNTLISHFLDIQGIPSILYFS